MLTFKPLLFSSPPALSFSKSQFFFPGIFGAPSFSCSLCASLESRYRAPSSFSTITGSDLGNRNGSFVRTTVISRRAPLSPAKKMDALLTYARRGVFAEIETIREEDNVAGPLDFETPLKIVLYPDPRLRAKNKRINVFDEKLEKLADEMFDIMYRTDGVGLSAPQVGMNVKMMVYNPEGERGKGKEIVLVNPRISKYANKRYVYTEGCLSFPQIEADVERPVSVRIEAQNIKGKKFSIHLKEFQARIFQHEYDHLQGTLFFQRMTPEVLETIIPALEKLEKAYEERTGLPTPERIRNKK